MSCQTETAELNFFMAESIPSLFHGSFGSGEAGDDEEGDVNGAAKRLAKLLTWDVSESVAPPNCWKARIFSDLAAEAWIVPVSEVCERARRISSIDDAVGKDQKGANDARYSNVSPI